MSSERNDNSSILPRAISIIEPRAVYISINHVSFARKNYDVNHNHFCVIMNKRDRKIDYIEIMAFRAEFHPFDTVLAERNDIK